MCQYKTFKEYKEQTGYSKSQLAEKFEVSKTTIARWLRGEPMRPRIADHISVLTGIPIENLVCPWNVEILNHEGHEDTKEGEG